MADVADLANRWRRYATSAAEAGFFLWFLTARLKSCPSRSFEHTGRGRRNFRREAGSSCLASLARRNDKIFGRRSLLVKLTWAAALAGLESDRYLGLTDPHGRLVDAAFRPSRSLHEAWACMFADGSAGRWCAAG
jgi:hypothetical protein